MTVYDKDLRYGCYAYTLFTDYVLLLVRWYNNSIALRSYGVSRPTCNKLAYLNTVMLAKTFYKFLKVLYAYRVCLPDVHR